MRKLGISSYSYTWAIGVPGMEPPQPLGAFDLLQEAIRLGVGVVQFCENLPLVKLPPKELDELAARASENQVAIEVGTRGLEAENLLAHLALAKKFGAPFVRLVVDSKGHQPSPKEAVVTLERLLGRFADAGIKLGIENHDRFSAATLAGMIEALGPARAGICLDTVNSFGALEGPEVVVKTLAPYALNLHVKDFTIQRVGSQMGFVINGCAAGKGRLNVPWLLEQLQAAGRDVNAIIELWTPFDFGMKETLALERSWVEESVRNLRPYIPN